MIRPLKTILSYLATAALSAVIVVLPPVYPLLVVTVAYLLTAVLTVAAVCCAGVLIALSWFWTRYRVGGWQTDLRLEAATAQFASDMQTVMPSASNTHEWNAGYERFTYIGLVKRSLSFQTMKPYIATRKQVYWTWMKDQLIKSGWAIEKDGVTQFISDKPAVFRRFALLVRRGDIVLLPHPQLPPPAISLWIQDFNMANMAKTANMQIIEVR